MLSATFIFAVDAQPLLVLFARFYIRSYFAKDSQKQPTKKAAAAPVANGNAHSNGHAKGKGRDGRKQ